MPTVRLSWNPNPAEQLVHSYEVHEQVNDGFWNLIATVPVPSYSFVASGGLRRWKVRAVNFVGLSDFSTVLEGPSGPTPPDGLTISIE